MMIKNLCTEIDTKYEELKSAMRGTDLKKIKALTLEMHALVHPAIISGRSRKTLADYVLDYMLDGNQNELVPRKKF